MSIYNAIRAKTRGDGWRGPDCYAPCSQQATTTQSLVPGPNIHNLDTHQATLVSPRFGVCTRLYSTRAYRRAHFHHDHIYRTAMVRSGPDYNQPNASKLFCNPWRTPGARSPCTSQSVVCAASNILSTFLYPTSTYSPASEDRYNPTPSTRSHKVREDRRHTDSPCG
jgi:hypothetical protein